MNEELTRNLRKQLTKKEQIILADFWESETRHVVQKVFGLRQLQLAQYVLKASADHYYTVEQRGRANELAEMAKFFSDNLKKINNEREKK